MLSADVAQLLEMSPAQLDDIYQASPAGAIPRGERKGTPLLAPGTKVGGVAARVARRFAWQGKAFDPDRGELRARGVPVVYGDAANPIVLDHAAIEKARLLAVLVPDVATAELATRAAHSLRPDLDIVARVSQATDVERLRQAGATEVVQPEFEAGVEVIRHALARYGVGVDELDHEVATRRQSFYQGETPG
jgi:CPA2 family monovalent cation:H+ antiporter-2